MTWVKLDDGFFMNRKARAAGLEGRALHTASWCYCSQQMNDGQFPVADIPLVAVMAGVDPSVADVLVELGLWHDIDGVIEVHDYLKYNPSRADILERKEKAAKAAAVGHAKRRASSSTERTAERMPIPSPSPEGVLVDRLQTGSTGDPGPVDDGDEGGGVDPAVWTSYAEQKCALTANVRNPGPWKKRVAVNAKGELSFDAVELDARYDLKAHEVATVLLARERGETVPWLRDRERRASTEGDQ